MGEDSTVPDQPSPTPVVRIARSSSMILDPGPPAEKPLEENALSKAQDTTNYHTLPPSIPKQGILSNPRYTSPFGSLTIGHTLSHYPVLLWILCCSIPLAYLVLMFGAIPIGERRDDDGSGIPGHTQRFYHYWVFTCVVNPINMTVVSFLNCGIFLTSMGVARPFRVHLSILASVFITEVVVFNLTVPFVGTFDLLGVVSLFLCYITTFISIYVYETWKVTNRSNEGSVEVSMEKRVLHRYYWKFVKVAVAFLIFYLVLLLYMWAFQHVSSTIGQKLVPFAMTIGVFIVRKFMLALTDEFPISTAMLISGFWVENIYDMFQTMAYRNVKQPINYVSIWFTNALSLLANLVFLTDTWFEFRIWIKAYLPLAFKGKCTPWRLHIKPDFTEDENERGHSNNKIGYHRRQGRFFMYKLLSKVIAASFYLINSTVLRYGLNHKLFPFGTDTYAEYTHSLQFSAYNLIFLNLAGILAATYVRTRHRALFNYFTSQSHEVLTNRLMLGSIVALLTSNGIIAISMMMYFNMIYLIVRKE